jgi:hypothetical protein
MAPGPPKQRGRGTDFPRVLIFDVAPVPFRLPPALPVDFLRLHISSSHQSGGMTANPAGVGTTSMGDSHWEERTVMADMIISVSPSPRACIRFVAECVR